MSETKINLTGQQINNALKLAATSCSVAASKTSLSLKFVGTAGSYFTAEIPVVSADSCGVMTSAQYSDLENTKAKVSALETKAEKIATRVTTTNSDLLFSVKFTTPSGANLYGFDIPKASETSDGLMRKEDKRKLERMGEVYYAIRVNGVQKDDDIIVTPIGTTGILGLDISDGKLILFIAGQYTTRWTASQNRDGLSSEDFKRANVIINATGALYGFNGKEFVH